MPATASATLAVSTVIFALRPGTGAGITGAPEGALMTLWLPLVRRTREPYLDSWALPGGWLPADEELPAAAARTLRETTGLAPKYLEQLYTFGDLGRSPDGRVVSVVYWALVQSDEAAMAAVGENVRWFPADHLPPLAFDHNSIVDYALWRLRTKVEYSRIAHAFLGETFTLAQLREVHEAVLQRALDPANFRRTVTASGTLIDTGESVAGTPHRPPRLYRYTVPAGDALSGDIKAADAGPPAFRAPEPHFTPEPRFSPGAPA